MTGLKPVTVGSRWWAGTNVRFKVTKIAEDTDGHIWVHYRNDKLEDSLEYSCYVEAFKQRFSEIPE